MRSLTCCCCAPALTFLGPYFVNEDLTLRVNKGSWNRLYGMLFIEQVGGLVGAANGANPAIGGR